MEQSVFQGELRNGWEIVTRFENEGNAPWVIDLSHAQKFDIPNPPLFQGRFQDISLPEKPGGIHIQRGLISSRLNGQQSFVLNLTKLPITVIDDIRITDVTDAFALLALIGHSVFEILETVTSLDLFAPGKKPPFVLQGPVLGLRSILFLLQGEKKTPVILVAVPRGYGQSFTEALLRAGEPWDLSPAGENVFFDFFEHADF